MNDKILIRVSSDPTAQLQWLELDHDNLPTATGKITWEQLAKKSEQWREKIITVLLPGACCVHIYEKIPAKNIRQLRAALPYSVEDQFAQEIESLHFAIGDRDAEGYVNAEAVDKDYFNGVLSNFEKAGLIPRNIIADYQALPQLEDASCLLIEENQVLIRFEDGASSAVFHQLLPLFLQQRASSVDDEEKEDDIPVKKKLIIFCASKEPAITELIKNIQQEFSVDWEIFIDKDEQSGSVVVLDSLTMLSENISNKKIINFLQGAFKRKAPASKIWQAWRWSAVAASLLLFLLIGEWGLDYWKLSNHLQALKIAQKKVYLQTFKSARRVLRPVSQMRGKLNSLGGGTSNSQFLPVMVKLASAAGFVKNTQISNITFRANRGEMKVDYYAPDFATIQKFQDKLKALGLNIIPGASNQNGDQYKGRVTIKEQS